MCRIGEKQLLMQLVQEYTPEGTRETKARARVWLAIAKRILIPTEVTVTEDAEDTVVMVDYQRGREHHTALAVQYDLYAKEQGMSKGKVGKQHAEGRATRNSNTEDLFSLRGGRGGGGRGAGGREAGGRGTGARGAGGRGAGGRGAVAPWWYEQHGR